MDLGDLGVLVFPSDLGISDRRTRGLTEAGCLTLAQEVRGPKIVAYCYRDGTPDRGWHRPSKPSPPTCDDCRAPKDTGGRDAGDQDLVDSARGEPAALIRRPSPGMPRPKVCVGAV